MSSPTPNGSAEANQTVSETDAQEQGKSENQEEIIENTTAEQRLSQRNVNKGRVEGFAASIDSLSQYHVLVLSEIADKTVQSDIERLNEITTQLENSIAEIHKEHKQLVNDVGQSSIPKQIGIDIDRLTKDSLEIHSKVSVFIDAKPRHTESVFSARTRSSNRTGTSRSSARLRQQAHEARAEAESLRVKMAALIEQQEQEAQLLIQEQKIATQKRELELTKLKGELAAEQRRQLVLEEAAEEEEYGASSLMRPPPPKPTSSLIEVKQLIASERPHQPPPPPPTKTGTEAEGGQMGTEQTSKPAQPPKERNDADKQTDSAVNQKASLPPTPTNTMLSDQRHQQMTAATGQNQVNSIEPDQPPVFRITDTPEPRIDHYSRSPPAMAPDHPYTGPDQLKTPQPTIFDKIDEFNMDKDHHRSPYPTPQSHKSDQAQLAEALLEAIEHSIENPKVESPKPFIFTGNLTDYPDWRASINRYVRDRRGRPEDKLANLRTYLSPDYHRVINAYCTIGTERAWKEALDALDEEFGDQFQIGKAYIKELNDWPRVGNNDGPALKRYLGYLKQCASAMAKIPTLEDLNSLNEQKRIIKKLPVHIERKWVSKTTEFYENYRKWPKLDDLCRFLQHQVKIACNPLNDDTPAQPDRKQGNEGKQNRDSGRDQNRNRQRKPGQATSHNTTTQKEHKKECLKCDKNNHYTADCGFISRMAEDDRQKFISNNRLCFYCLMPNHSYKECETKLKCKVTGCGKKHATVHHDKLTKTKPSEPTTGNDEQPTLQAADQTTKSATVQANLRNQPPPATVSGVQRKFSACSSCRCT